LKLAQASFEWEVLESRPTKVGRLFSFPGFREQGYPLGQRSPVSQAGAGVA
jgi:hypothetical protein